MALAVILAQEIAKLGTRGFERCSCVASAPLLLHPGAQGPWLQLGIAFAFRVVFKLRGESTK